MNLIFSRSCLTAVCRLQFNMEVDMLVSEQATLREGLLKASLFSKEEVRPLITARGNA
jgi:hypothetical protein